jgi:hypothetical protein
MLTSVIRLARKAYAKARRHSFSDGGGGKSAQPCAFRGESLRDPEFDASGQPLF